MKDRTWLLWVILSWCVLPTQAQFLVPETQPATVFVDGKTLASPWIGGLNQPQFSLADFDGDGQPELLVYDRNAGFPQIFTWKTATSTWEWMPGQGRLFPEGKGWMLARYANCDSWPDLFLSTGQNNQVSYWKGTGPWTWVLEDSILMADSDAVFVLGIDIPAISDVDGDGYIDILSFNPPGSQVLFYRQMGGCDSVSFTLGYSCWGNFTEGGLNNLIFLNTSCFTSGTGSVETGGAHAGSTLAVHDVNGDGLLDLLIGDLNEDAITYVRNGGVPAFAVMDSVAYNYPAGPHPVDLRRFPAPFVLDVNQDGRKDLLVVPNDQALGRNANQVWYYEDQGPGPGWKLIRKQTDFLVGDMLDLGERSHPASVDVNGDGLLDLVVGNGSFRPGNQGSSSGLALFLNTGTAALPAFDLVTRDWLGLSNLFNPSIFGLRPTFGDIDGDGDLDLLVGDQSGKLHVFLNSAGPGSALQLSLQFPEFEGIDVGRSAAPFLADITGDGLVDVVVGNEAGTLTFFENTTTPGSITLGTPQPNWGAVNLSGGPCCPGHAVPFLEKNSEGDWELFVGSGDGHLFQFTDILNPIGGAFTLSDSTYGLAERIPHLSPLIFDPQQDGQRDWVIGNQLGGLRWFSESSVNTVRRPGPLVPHFWAEHVAEDQVIRVSWKEKRPTPTHVRLMTLTGQIAVEATFPPEQTTGEFSTQALPPGLYLLTIPGWRAARRIVVSR